jgi:3,4-dihydroxy 2-butanone 4-phosphate synthase/GTP cyclohydrolase II
VKKEIEIQLPTKYGNFSSSIYKDREGKEHILMIHEKTDLNDSVILRIHSECLTGDLFHSLRCDCGDQLNESLKIIGENGGILIYLRQEGRGIGLTQKYFAYKIQDAGYDTVEANEKLGFPSDLRTFIPAVTMLADIGVNKVRLLTNNPLKIKELKENSIEVIERIPLLIQSNEFNDLYMNTKKEKMGHLLNA